MSADPHQDRSDENRSMTPCRVCQEPIRSKALKCTRCGSYQDWSRHLLRWSALLVSLFALAPLWSISDSLSQLAFSSKASRIEAAVTACDHRQVRVAYENSGELSGIVTAVNLYVEREGSWQKPDVTIRNNQDDPDILVVPGQPPVMVVYRGFIESEPTNIFPAHLAAKECRYRVDVEWTDLKGAQQQMSRECRCR